MDFAHYQSPKLLGSSPPITNKHAVFRESGTDFWRLSDISAKSGMVGKKIKILDRPGFSRHMKTRLKGAKFRRTDLRKVKGHIADHLRSLGN